MSSVRSNSSSGGRGRVVPVTTPDMPSQGGLPNPRPNGHQQLVVNTTYPPPSASGRSPFNRGVYYQQVFNKLMEEDREDRRWYEDELQNQRNVVAWQSHRIVALEQELLALRQLLETLEAQKNEAVQLEVDKAAEQLATLRNELEQMKDEKEDLVQVNTEIDAQLKESNSNVRELKEQIDAAEEAAVAEGTAAQEAKDQIENKLKDLKVDLNAVVVARSKAEEEVTALKARISEMEDFEEESENKRRWLQDLLELSQKAQNAFKSDLATKEAKLEEATEKVDSLQRDLDAAQADRNTCTTKLDECNTNNDKLSKELETAQSVLRTYKAEIDDVEKNNKSLRSDIKNKKSTITKLEEDSRNAEDQKTALVAERTAAEDRYVTQKQLTTDLQEQVKKSAAEKSLMEREREIACEKNEKHFQQVTSFFIQKIQSLKAENRGLRVATRIYKVQTVNRQDQIDSARRAIAPRQSQPPRKHLTPTTPSVKPDPAKQLLSPVSVISNDMKENETGDNSPSSFEDPMHAFMKDNEVQSAAQESKVAGPLTSDGSPCFRKATKDDFQNLAREGLKTSQGQPKNATLSEVIAGEQAANSMSDNATVAGRTSHPLPNPLRRPSANSNSLPSGPNSTPETPVSTGPNNSRTKGIAVDKKPAPYGGVATPQNQRTAGELKRKGDPLEKQPPKGLRQQGDSNRPPKVSYPNPYKPRG